MPRLTLIQGSQWEREKATVSHYTCDTSASLHRDDEHTLLQPLENIHTSFNLNARKTNGKSKDVKKSVIKKQKPDADTQCKHGREMMKKRINHVDALNYILLFGMLNLLQCKNVCACSVSVETLSATNKFHKLSLLWCNICNHNINVSAFATIIRLLSWVLSPKKRNTISTSLSSIVRHRSFGRQILWFTPSNLSSLKSRKLERSDHS